MTQNLSFEGWERRVRAAGLACACQNRNISNKKYLIIFQSGHWCVILISTSHTDTEFVDEH